MNGSARNYGRSYHEVVVVSLLPYKFATRSRKAVRQYDVACGSALFVSLQGAGRAGHRDEAGRTRDGNIDIHQVVTRKPKSGTSARDQVVNLLTCYLPAYLRLFAVVLRTPSKVIHVQGVHLIPIAVLHRIVHRSRPIVDINERPASVATKGSLFSSLRRVERPLLRMVRSDAYIVLCVTPGHADILRDEFGVAAAMVVRNAPMQGWAGDYGAPVVADPFRFVTVGSIFEGRAFEMLIDAMALIPEGLHVSLDIIGEGSAEYVDGLRKYIRTRDVVDRVQVLPGIPTSAVADAYRSGHVGLALYEAYSEGNDSLSNKILECVASQRPVLAGNLSENHRFIKSNGAGWLTNVSAEAIAQAMREIVVDEQGYRTALERARITGPGLTWENEFTKVEQLL